MGHIAAFGSDHQSFLLLLVSVMKLLLFTLLAVAVAVEACEMEPEGEHHHHRRKPRFCGKHQCPRFWTVARRCGYDVRCYASSTWALTKGHEKNQRLFKDEFRRLTSYIRGSNVEHKKMPMAVPAITYTIFNRTARATTSLVGYYLPTRCNSTVPAPTDSKVFIHKIPRFCVYVRSFPGYVMGLNEKVWKNLWKLSGAVKRDGKSYKFGQSVKTVYNGPAQLFFRYNEVFRFPSRRDEEEYMSMVEFEQIEERCEGGEQ